MCTQCVAKGEAQEACEIDQRCGGLQAGKEGGVHDMYAVWEMQWAIRHEWPSGARFCFNCYQHHALLVNHEAKEESVIISSQEGVTQGDPLSMICYGIGILRLIRMLRTEFTDEIQPWFADDGLTAGYFPDIRAQFF